MFFIKSEPYTRALYKLPQEEKVSREVTIENSITSFWAISFQSTEVFFNFFSEQSLLKPYLRKKQPSSFRKYELGIS